MKKLFFFIFLLILMVLPSVNANSVGIDSDHNIEIIRWTEDDYVEKNSLKVNTTLIIELEEEDIDSFILKFDPSEREHTTDDIDKDEFIAKICQRSKCEELKPIWEGNRTKFIININRMVYKSEVIEIRIEYTLKKFFYKNWLINFLEGNHDKLIILTTSCKKTTKVECSYNNIKKFVYLPLNTAVRIYPSNTSLRRVGASDRVYMEFTDFVEDDIKTILFSDLSQIRWWNIFWFILGILITLGISHLIKPRHQKKLEEDIDATKISLTPLNQTIKNKFDKTVKRVKELEKFNKIKFDKINKKFEHLKKLHSYISSKIKNQAKILNGLSNKINKFKKTIKKQ